MSHVFSKLLVILGLIFTVVLLYVFVASSIKKTEKIPSSISTEVTTTSDKNKVRQVIDKIIGSNDYCTMGNDCPSDKCKRSSYCAPSDDGLGGCALGGYTCEYKDQELKENYKENTQAEAKDCLMDFIEQNAIQYEKFQHIDFSTLDMRDDTNYCHGHGIDYNEADNYCWYAEIGTDAIQDGSKYGITFLIGAQTCEVHTDKHAFKAF